ncbi:permease [Paracoccus sp. SCSIO 75233]|uniref:permease n=1 Tax=Paracoccus sp. SCSIO 75233 TaxID=3017782 RepID=UPI0022F07973|nr:permease [Paracoccus sp. SCSIO 75233]WBU53833.1 permease [Paracoccus sp. SCSIO 75233]
MRTDHEAGHDWMTVKFDQGTEPPEGVFQPQSAMEDIEIAGALFRGCAEDLTLLRRRLRAGEIGDLKDAVKVARELRSATQLMLEERNKVEKLRKDIAGGVGAGAFDLAAARDEIGRRLACLRRAGGG